MKEIRNSIGPIEFAALYQQNPVPDTGEYFKSEWLQYYEILPHLAVFGASDYALTAGKNDYTVHMVFGVDSKRNIYILDMWRKQAGAAEWMQAFIELVKHYKPLFWGDEAGLIDKSVAPYRQDLLRKSNIYVDFKKYPATGSKTARARSIQALLSSGRVFFPKKAVWLADLQRELLRFPSGRNDDQVDALSIIGRMVYQLPGGIVEHGTEHVSLKTRFKFLLNKIEDKTWRTT